METPPKKIGFSMSNAATGAKRSAELPTASSKKIPKVADMKVEAPRQQSQRPQMNAPVNLCIYKVTENSGDLWAAFPDTKLWQIQLEHDARPSVSVNIVASLNDFLKEASKNSSGGVPDTVQKLQSEAGIKLTLTNMDDPDGKRDGILRTETHGASYKLLYGLSLARMVMGPQGLGCYVQYRVAFYVAGEVDALTNAFMLLDGYFQFMAKRLARATPFEIHIYPHDSVEDALSSLEETMSYKPITVHAPGKDLLLKWCQAHPAVSKQILCCFL